MSKKVYVEAEVVTNDTIETKSTTQEIIDQSEKVFESYYRNKQSIKEDKKQIIKDEKLIEKINSQLSLYESEIPKIKKESDLLNDSILFYQELLNKKLKTKKIDSTSLKEDTLKLIDKISSFKELNKNSIKKT